MNPGELNKKIELQSVRRTRSTLGEPVAEWLKISTPWAKIWVDVGKEQVDAVRVDSILTGGAVIRWRSGVVPEMRVLWNGEQWEVSAVADLDGSRRFLRLWIKRHV